MLWTLLHAQNGQNSQKNQLPQFLSNRAQLGLKMTGMSSREKVITIVESNFRLLLGENCEKQLFEECEMAIWVNMGYLVGVKTVGICCNDPKLISNDSNS